MFSDQSRDTIKNRMLGNLASGYSKVEGSFPHDVISPMSIELEEAYGNIDKALAVAFPQTSSGIYLEMKANEHGVSRKTANKAIGTIRVEGTPGTTITIGSRLLSDGGVEFETTETRTITTPVTIKIAAVNAGTEGNVVAGSITRFSTTIIGVTTVSNTEATSGGNDAETDEELLARLLEKVRNPAASGNKNHYIQWAKEVNGIGDAKCIPCWNGGGTVKVVVIDADKNPVSSTLVSKVQEYIDPTQDASGEGLAPIGASVTVVSATTKTIDIVATITLTDDNTIDGIKDTLKATLVSYIKSTAFKISKVSYIKLGSIILDVEGVVSVDNLTVNGGTTDIALIDTEIAVLGSVIVNDTSI